MQIGPIIASLLLIVVGLGMMMLEYLDGKGDMGKGFVGFLMFCIGIVVLLHMK